MQLVEKLIGDLLLKHNCVIVPSFGGFVAQRVGARLDELSGIIYPPRKSVLFNRQLINNDGLLIATLSHELKCDFDVAHKEVLRTIQEWEKLLKSGERISIDRVGFLYRDTEMNLCFEQDKFYNLLLESFGMSSVHFVSAEDATAAETHEAVQKLVQETIEAPILQLNGEIQPIVQDPVPVYQIAEKRKSATWKYAAAVIALPIAFYSVWIPLKTDVLESGILSLDDFNPFRQNKPLNIVSSKVPLPEFRESTPQLADLPAGDLFSLRIDENTYVPVRLNEGGTTQAATAEMKEVPSTAVRSKSFVIVGCFSNAGNAEKLAEELKRKGFDAQVLPAGNMTRVSAGNGEHFAELLPKLRAEGLDAWVLK